MNTGAVMESAEKSFVAVSHFTVANDTHEAVAEAFRQRPHEVDSVPGFRRMEVWNTEGDGRCFTLVTWWDSADCFQRWHRSHAYKEAHRGMPKGLRLVSGSTRIEHFNLLCE